jgi:hypothetical protein
MSVSDALSKSASAPPASSARIPIPGCRATSEGPATPRVRGFGPQTWSTETPRRRGSGRAHVPPAVEAAVLWHVSSGGTTCTEGVGLIALRAIVSRKTFRGRCAVDRLCRSARTHESLRTPVFKFVTPTCPELPSATYRCQMRGFSVATWNTRCRELPALSESVGKTLARTPSATAQRQQDRASITTPSTKTRSQGIWGFNCPSVGEAPPSNSGRR